MQSGISCVILFINILNTRKQVSFISGKSLSHIPIGSQFWFNLFAHVLSKAQNRYPKFKLNPENITLLTPEEHYALDFGTKEQRLGIDADWDKLYKLRDSLKIKYNEIYSK